MMTKERLSGSIDYSPITFLPMTWKIPTALVKSISPLLFGTNKRGYILFTNRLQTVLP